MQADVGIAIVPRITVAQELRDGTLVSIPVRELSMPRRTLMIYREQGYVSRRGARADQDRAQLQLGGGNQMRMNRRAFVRWSAAAGVGATAAACSSQPPAPGGGAAPPAPAADALPASIAALAPMTDGVVPIADDERKARMEKARTLMAENARSTRCSSSPVRACTTSPA